MAYQKKRIEVIVTLNSGQRMSELIEMSVCDDEPCGLDLELVETGNALALYSSPNRHLKQQREVVLPGVTIADLASLHLEF